MIKLLPPCRIGRTRVLIMSRFFVVGFVSLFIFVAQAQTVASIQRGSFKYNVPLKEVKQAYQMVNQNTLNAPSSSQFIKDYVRYQVALLEAYNDKSLFQTSKVRSQIKNESLRSSIDQATYKAFIEKQMKSEIISLNKKVRAISDSSLKKSYSRNPAFNFHFILIDIPPAAQNLNKIKKRAYDTYSKVLKDKRPFKKLVSLYSDNGSIGTSNVVYTKNSLYPLIYNALKNLSPSQVSKPIQTPNGFYILRLNKVVPFSKVSKDAIRNQIFNDRRTKVFNQRLNKIQSKYKIVINKTVAKNL